MKKILIPLCALVLLSCGGKSEAGGEADSLTAYTSTADVPTRELEINEPGFHHTYIVAEQDDARHIYKETVNLDNTLLVISKREYRLYVYEATASDTLLAASFPVCYAIRPEAKQTEGDNCTPECSLESPFRVSEIKDASTWEFDFDDGRGSQPAFGAWFIRLDLSRSFPDNPALARNRSIGIHGSTGNERSVPGRDSHGCVRLRDDDLLFLRDHYVQEGMKVVIKGIDEDKLPFEQAAELRLGASYQAPTPNTH